MQRDRPSFFWRCRRAGEPVSTSCLSSGYRPRKPLIQPVISSPNHPPSSIRLFCSLRSYPFLISPQCPPPSPPSAPPPISLSPPPFPPPPPPPLPSSPSPPLSLTPPPPSPSPPPFP